MPPFLHLMRPGDWLVLAAAAAVCVVLVPFALSGGAPEKAVVKRDGAVVAELPLSARRTLDVPGPIGVTRIEIQPGRARVASDPGAHQYCVRQGWLTQANAIAICAPNHVSLALTGKNAAYDTLNY
ncbi:MAG: NusG domain II-containing protein [Rhodocyclaceae bacterium]|nr:NusG domain II-containing protein [Rhodocyclaceae bacterium]